MTSPDLRIDDICRTERYYTATLLPAVLLHDSFRGLARALERLDDRGVRAVSTADGTPARLWNGGVPRRVELVTEMDIVRDARFYANWLPDLERVQLGDGELLRPDVVVVADGLLFVLEAKFFHREASAPAVRSQMAAQRAVIESILLRFPGYAFDRYCHAFLAAHDDFSPSSIGAHACLTWTDVRDLATEVLGEAHYVTGRLEKAVEMYALVQRRRSQGAIGTNYRGVVSFHEIMTRCEAEGDRLWVGFQGGLTALAGAEPAALRKRRFKWDWRDDPILPKEPRNWLPGSVFARAVAKARGGRAE